MTDHPAITECRLGSYTIPTDRPESDGTLKWDSTTLVLVELTAGNVTGTGYTYADASTAKFIASHLWPIVRGTDPSEISQTVRAMDRAIRNLGQAGVSAMAISAVDTALWDLKARLLDVSLVSLLGQAQEEVAIYGSGGFTSYRDDELREQTARWADAGIPRVKIKVGRDPDADPHRVDVVRGAIGDAELFVDANGAYSRKEALAMMDRFGEAGVCWLEEPVSSDDRAGLRLLRERAPAKVDIAAGEYGYRPDDFRLLLEAQAVDVLQADATRCRGVTGFLKAKTLAEAFHVPFSAHCAPSLHCPLSCVAGGVRHIEYFHDHVRIESNLFDGFIGQEAGTMRPAGDRPGLGLTFKHQDAQHYDHDETRHH